MKLKTKINLMMILFILLLIGCQSKYPTIRTGRPQSSNSLQQSPNVDVNRILNPQIEKNSEDLSESEINLENIGKKNPFVNIIEEEDIENKENELIPFPGPLPELKVEQTNLYLSGISISENKKLAIINHRILKLGDEIEGKEVIFINLDKVILKNKAGMEIELYLKK